jgi:NAD(P)H-nitrite reductase large subunit
MTGGGLAAPDVKPDVMQLKVSGIEVGAFGSPEVPSGARVVGGLDEDGRMYRKVVIAQGRIIGAQLVGAPGTCRLLPAVTASAVDPGLLRALDAGDWLAVERAAALV